MILVRLNKDLNPLCHRTSGQLKAQRVQETTLLTKNIFLEHRFIAIRCTLKEQRGSVHKGQQCIIKINAFKWIVAQLPLVFGSRDKTPRGW